MARTTPRDVDSYIAGFPAPTQRLLKSIRATIRKAVPAAEERISYQIPTYTLNGRSVYFAAFNAHIGLYPVSADIKAALGKALAPYGAAGAKATARFPLSKPIPHALVRRIVKLKLKRRPSTR
jgi:uncharacterized protein YdhG (YjbR/CyaY superfamily)